MKAMSLGAVVVAGLLAGAWVCAEEPIIPPTIASMEPAGLERGTTATFTIEGRNLSNASEVLFDGPGIRGTLSKITDVTEKITGPRAGEDLDAQVPLGKKQTAQLEITVAGDAKPGIHRLRVKTPLGTSNMIAFAVGTLPEIKKQEKMSMESSGALQSVPLPATLVGSIETTGAKDSYQFAGKAGEDVVFRVEASRLGSKLTSMLTLSDASGQVLASAGQNTDRRDAELHFTLPQAGNYTIAIGDRDMGGGKDYFYRLDGGDLPLVTSVFPLGVPAGEATEIAVKGVNLGGAKAVKVQAAPGGEGWTTMPVAMAGILPINEPRLAVGHEPEIGEQEPNDTPAQAQKLTLPVTINGHIDGGEARNGKPDEDYFRFRAKKGEKLSIGVAAARLGSQLDSVIEVLDGEGREIPRATIRCLNETTTTLADRDSRTAGIRLVSTSGLREGDYVMVGDELDRIDFIPDQPDADTILTSMGGLRMTYLGTSPDVHAVNTPVYKAQILPPGAEVPSNGLPVFRLTWRNDDGGAGYGADSKLDFVAPADGEYILHLKDVRSMEGEDFAYRLTIRDAEADFHLRAEPENPNIPRGGSTTVRISVDTDRDFNAPIAIEAKGLPHGVTASPATIPVGQISTVLVLSAAADAATDMAPAPIQFVGRAQVDGREIVRTANRDGDEDAPLQVASITPAPDVLVTTDAKEVALEPGKDTTVTLHVERRNGFKGRVPCLVENLPPGVRVVNVGLNGVLVTEAQTSRTFTLHAEDWAQASDQPFYVVGMVESNSSTMHPSLPVRLKVSPATLAKENGSNGSATEPAASNR